MSIDDCYAIAQLQIEWMREKGLVEAVREIRDCHSTKG